MSNHCNCQYSIEKIALVSRIEGNMARTSSRKKAISGKYKYRLLCGKMRSTLRTKKALIKAWMCINEFRVCHPFPSWSKLARRNRLTNLKSPLKLIFWKCAGVSPYHLHVIRASQIYDQDQRVRYHTSSLRLDWHRYEHSLSGYLGRSIFVSAQLQFVVMHSYMYFFNYFLSHVRRIFL